MRIPELHTGTDGELKEEEGVRSQKIIHTDQEQFSVVQSSINIDFD